MIIVTDNGFQPDDRAERMEAGTYAEFSLAELADANPGKDVQIGLRFDVADDPALAKPYLNRVSQIVVPFSSFADGRGFSIALELRRIGFNGTLLAEGHLITDQYAHARRCGFDAAAISDAQAERQPEAQWLSGLSEINETYQTRLHQAAKVA